MSFPSHDALGVSPGLAGWRLEHSYGQLSGALHVAVAPTRVRAPKLVILNRPLAAELGLDAEALATEAEVFAGNRLPPGAGLFCRPE
jgi:uncharacterized protein YdiU (UPF0061 family)